MRNTITVTIFIYCCMYAYYVSFLILSTYSMYALTLGGGIYISDPWQFSCEALDVFLLLYEHFDIRLNGSLLGAVFDKLIHDSFTEPQFRTPYYHTSRLTYIEQYRNVWQQQLPWPSRFSSQWARNHLIYSVKADMPHQTEHL